ERLAPVARPPIIVDPCETAVEQGGDRFPIGLGQVGDEDAIRLLGGLLAIDWSRSAQHQAARGDRPQRDGGNHDAAHADCSIASVSSEDGDGPRSCAGEAGSWSTTPEYAHYLLFVKIGWARVVAASPAGTCPRGKHGRSSDRGREGLSPPRPPNRT